MGDSVVKARGGKRGRGVGNILGTGKHKALIKESRTSGIHLMLMSFLRNSLIFVLDTCSKISTMYLLGWRSYVIGDGLINEPDIGNPSIKVLQALIDVHSHPLQDEAAVLA